MTTRLLTQGELLEELEIDNIDFQQWTRLGLIRPASGQGADALYTPDNLESARQIKSLLETGFDLPAVQKIIRKVGLPSGGTGKKKGAGHRLLTVGELAERTGLNPRTLRYWEERGIIQPDGRSTGGFRLYSEQTATIIQLIRDLQLFGYSLEEIKDAAEFLRDFFAFSEGVEVDGSEERLDSMLASIQQLEERISVLKEGIKRWDELFRKRKRELNRIRERVTGSSSR